MTHRLRTPAVLHTSLFSIHCIQRDDPYFFLTPLKDTVHYYKTQGFNMDAYCGLHGALVELGLSYDTKKQRLLL